MGRWQLAIMAVAVLLLCDLVHAQTYRFCGSPLDGNAFNRPIDYNDKTKDSLSKIRLVERYHFTPKVESLQEGESGAIELDLAYTLRQVPNHYRALATMARWQAINGYSIGMEAKSIYSADCYFRRALTFRPEDPNLHVLYGIYFHQAGKHDEALREYKLAESLGPANAELHYNMGLLYAEKDEFDAAREHAIKAYSMGYPLVGLRNKLKRAGEWQTGNDADTE